MKNLKLITVVTAMSIFLLGSAFQPLHAKNLKIGYVDAERIFSESVVGRKGIERMKEYEAQKKDELDAKRSEIQKLEDELQNQYFTMSESAKQQKGEAIDRLKIELKRMAEDADRELNKMQQTYLEKIDREVIEIIDEIGKEEGYTLILGKIASTILYADPAIDITSEIIERYDAAQKE